MGSCSRAAFSTQLSTRWTTACSQLEALAAATLACGRYGERAAVLPKGQGSWPMTEIGSEATS